MMSIIIKTVNGFDYERHQSMLGHRYEVPEAPHEDHQDAITR